MSGYHELGWVYEVKEDEDCQNMCKILLIRYPLSENSPSLFCRCGNIIPKYPKVKAQEDKEDEEDVDYEDVDYEDEDYEDVDEEDVDEEEVAEEELAEEEVAEEEVHEELDEEEERKKLRKHFTKEPSLRKQLLIDNATKQIPLVIFEPVPEED